MARNYSNIVDYVRTELQTFAERSVCRVDSLVFSWLAYFRIPPEAVDAYESKGMPLKDLFRADWYAPMCEGVYDVESSTALICALMASPRFRDVGVSGYVSYTNEQTEQQFSAMTFSLPEVGTFVAYRGTDNTLVGWKEDFNMAFQSVIPSQVAAVRYLDDVAVRTEGDMWSGGHSKGGNLAVYAGVMCAPSTRARMVRCFSHDGPGFSQKTMADPRWEDARELIDKTIPQSSVVGMIFEQQERDYTVVHSHSLGFTQHDPFSWEVKGCDFVCERRLGASAHVLDSSINSWLLNASDQERECFVDAVFAVLAASGQSTFAGIKANWRTTIPLMALSITALDSEDRELVVAAVSDVLHTMLPFLPHVERLLALKGSDREVNA